MTFVRHKGYPLAPYMYSMHSQHTAIILIIIKTISTGPSWKKNRLEIAFATPQAPAPRKIEKHNWRKQPTIDCPLKPIQRSGVKHSVRNVIPHTRLGQQEHRTNWDVLHLDTSYCNG